ncbi:MAG: exosortase/archaeosortase family protein, partial [Candidatus Bathyarchaeia archaeon]
GLILALKAAILLAIILALHSQDLVMVFRDALQSEIMNYMLAIPPLFLYLIYRKRKMLRAVIPFEDQNIPKEIKYIPIIVGMLLCAAATTLYWYGSYTFTPLEYHVLTIPIFTAGLTLILFNAQTLRQAAFPIAFLALLIPPPAEILYAIGSTLSTVSSEASYMIIRAMNIPSILSEEYGNPTITIVRPNDSAIEFAIDVACSGIYSLIGFVVFAVFIAYITRDKLWKKIMVFLIGVPLIYALNILRITIILLIGYYYGEQPALEIFHLLGGWSLIFLGTILLLTVSEKMFKTNIFQKQQPCPKCSINKDQNEEFCSYCGRIITYQKINLKKSDMVKIVTVIVAVILLTSIQAPIFALTEGPAQIIVQTPAGEAGNTQILPEIQGYKLVFLYRDRKFEQRAKQDASLVYMYIPTNESKDPVYVSVEIASIKSSLHRWETCLITYPLSRGYQPSVTQLDLKDIEILENPPIIARFFAFQYLKTNVTQIVLYWYETAIFKINSTDQQKYVKISLVVFPDGVEKISEIEQQFTSIAKAIASYWQPIKIWSQITMIMSRGGLTLTIAITTLIATILAYQKSQEWRTEKINEKLREKLSEQDKLILQAVHQASKESKATIDTIILRYETLSGKNIKLEEIIKKLNEMEKLGFIRRTTTNYGDEPQIIWKTI